MSPELLGFLGTLLYVAFLIGYSWYMAVKAKKQARGTDELVLVRTSVNRIEALVKEIAIKNGVTGSVVA